MKKRLLSLLLILCMACTLLPVSALAATPADHQIQLELVKDGNTFSGKEFLRVDFEYKSGSEDKPTDQMVYLKYDASKLTPILVNGNDGTSQATDFSTPMSAYFTKNNYSYNNGIIDQTSEVMFYTIIKDGYGYICWKVTEPAGTPSFNAFTRISSIFFGLKDGVTFDAMPKDAIKLATVAEDNLVTAQTLSVGITTNNSDMLFYGGTTNTLTVDSDSLFVAGDGVTFATPIPPAPVNQTITVDNVTATYGDKDAKITASTNGDGALSYTVTSGTDVIDVDSNGNLTIKKVGTATVTITAAATANYKEATKDVTVTVNSKKLEPKPITGKQTLIVSYKNEDRFYDGTPKTCTVLVKVKDGPDLEENTDYTVTYHNNINATNNEQTNCAYFIVKPIAGRNYTWDEYRMNYIISKAPVTITAADVSAAVGETGKKIDATTNVQGSILNYAVTEGTDVISVNSDTGALTIHKAGSAKVTITVAETDNYKAATKVVNVKIVQNPLTGNVTITGDRLVDRTLTADVSQLNEKTHLSYQWYRGNEKIDDAISNTYTLTKDDLGKTITVEVKTTADSTVSGSKTATTDVISCEHTFTGSDTTVATLVTAGTCKDKAVYRYYCVLCDTVDPDENHTFEGEKNPNKHDGDTEVRGQKAATCTEAGYTGDTYCLDCNNKIATGTTIPATGHTLTYTASVVATCKVEGYRDYWQCRKCNNYYADKDAKTELSAEDVKPALNPDNHVRTEIKNIKAPTCTETGYTGDKWCLDCNTKIKDGSSIPALGHTFTTGEGDNTKPNYVPAGTGSYGITIERVKCVNCDAYDETNANAVKASLPINVSLRVQKDAASISNPPAGVQFIFSLYKEENEQMALVASRSFMKTTGAADEILPGQYIVEQTAATVDDAIMQLRVALPSKINPWTVTQTSVDMTNWTIDRTEYKIAFVLENDTYVLRIVTNPEIVITANDPETDPTTPGGEVEPTQPVSDIVAFTNIYKAVKQDDPPTPTPVIPDGPKHTNRRYPAKPAASTDTKKPDGVNSARTFDAGVALYVGMSVLSLTGTALVIGKKKEF